MLSVLLLAASDLWYIEWPIFKYSISVFIFLPHAATQWASSHQSLVLFSDLQWIIFQNLVIRLILMQSKLSGYELLIHSLML